MTRKSTIIFVLLLFSACAPIYKIVVKRVYPKSPANQAGLKVGDRILKINGEQIVSLKELNDILGKTPDGEKCHLTVKRDNAELELTIVTKNKSHYRFGFLFKAIDLHIDKCIKYIIWPKKISPDLKTFSIPFQNLAMMNKSSRSPQAKLLFHTKDLLISKGYSFTENYENADFIVKAEFKHPKDDPASKKDKLPFEAFRVLFVKRNMEKPFVKVSATIDGDKAKFYGIKDYVFSMLDAIFKNLPSCSYKKQPKDNPV